MTADANRGMHRITAEDGSVYYVAVYSDTFRVNDAYGCCVTTGGIVTDRLGTRLFYDNFDYDRGVLIEKAVTDLIELSRLGQRLHAVPARIGPVLVALQRCFESWSAEPDLSDLAAHHDAITELKAELHKVVP